MATTKRLVAAQRGLMFNGFADWVEMGKRLFPDAPSDWAMRTVLCVNRDNGDCGIWAEDENSSNKYHSFTYNGTTKNLLYYCYDTSGTGAQTNWSFSAVLGKFYDIVLMCRSGLIYCYVDSVLLGVYTPSIVLGTAGGTAGLTLKIARKRAAYSAITISYMALYNRAIAFPEPAPKNGLIGEWLFTDGKGTTLTDISGNGNHGTLNGGTWMRRATPDYKADYRNLSVDPRFQSAPKRTVNMTDGLATYAVSGGYGTLTRNGDTLTNLEEFIPLLPLTAGESYTYSVTVKNDSVGQFLLRATFWDGAVYTTAGLQIKLYSLDGKGGEIRASITITSPITQMGRIVFWVNIGTLGLYNLLKPLSSISLTDARIEKVSLRKLNYVESTQVVTLGKPFQAKLPYARNVWDMQVFDGRIYMGHGNSSNGNPATNSGPIPLVYFDPVAGQFVTQTGTFNAGGKTSLDEEQIDMFKILNGRLFIAGHDPRAPDDFSQGNWYDLVSGAPTWTKHRNIALTIHVFDMVSFNGRLFAACGRSISWVEGDYTTTGADVMMSSDDGATWTKLGTVQNDSYVFRCYTFFNLGADLYATVEYYSPLWDTVAYVMKISPTFTVTQVQIDTSILFTGVSTSANDPDIKMYRPVNFLGKCVYLAGFVYNDQQFIPRALIVMTSLTSCAKAVFPDSRAVPMDTLIRGGALYVLAHIREATARYENVIYKTTDLVTWTEIFSFYHSTFARSFEELNGTFYFGLGCDTEYIPDTVGTILQTKVPII